MNKRAVSLAQGNSAFVVGTDVMRLLTIKQEHIVIVATSEGMTGNVWCEECHNQLRTGDRMTTCVSKMGVLSFYHHRCTRIVRD